MNSASGGCEIWTWAIYPQSMWEGFMLHWQGLCACGKTHPQGSMKQAQLTADHLEPLGIPWERAKALGTTHSLVHLALCIPWLVLCVLQFCQSPSLTSLYAPAVCRSRREAGSSHCPTWNA